MDNNPYLVVGTGRSGTSFVADVLHNDMGIFMGKYFKPPDKTNPNGFYEDEAFRSLHRLFVGGKIPYPLFLDTVVQLIQQRQDMGIPWGFKDSKMSMMLCFYLPLLDKPRIIWARRDKALVVDSLIRCYNRTSEEADKFYENRTTLLERILRYRNPLIIEFNGKKSRKEVVQMVEEKWQKSC